MSIAKFNHTNPFIFKAGEGFKYYSLRDLFQNNGADTVYRIMGLYINDKGRYGDQPLALTPHYYVNMPSHLMTDVTKMIRDQEIIDQINRGEAGFKIRAYTNRNGGTSYSVEWVDISSDLPY